MLAGCETTAPVEIVRPPELAVAEPSAVAQGAGTPLPDVLIREACGSEPRHLCAVQALADFVAATPSPPVPATTPGLHDDQPMRSHRQALHDELWRLTAAFSRAQVAELAQHQPLAPLWQLRAQLSASPSRREQATRLRAWTQRWPEHPFTALPPSNLARLLQPETALGRVGLLVPLSGTLATAGRAVRDGFIAAWLDDPAPRKPPLHIYDSAARPVPELYEQALIDGIGLIVGPLGKERLDRLRRLRPEPAVLGLNYLDVPTCGARRVLGANDIPLRETDARCQAIIEHSGGGGAAGTPQNLPSQGKFLQFGLAIEDEAASLADGLHGDRLHRVLAIHGNRGWSVRGVRALADVWPFEVEIQDFADVKTLTESLGNAMRTTASTQRKEALESLLQDELEFLPRPRSDIDGVVAFVDHIEASALAPALKFHFAAHLPVYASSQSIRNASSLDELAGFRVVEMPFNLYPNPLWDTVRAAFEKGDGNIAALHALGMDAYRIAAHWGWTSSGEPLYGATGDLRLNSNGQVRRQLVWAHVSANEIRPVRNTSHAHVR